MTSLASARVRRDLVFTHHPDAAPAQAFLIHDPATSRYWRAGPLYFEVARCFAEHAGQDACAAVRACFDEPVADSEIESVLAELDAQGLLTLTPEALDAAHLSAKGYARALGLLGLSPRAKHPGLHADVNAFLANAAATSADPVALFPFAGALEAVEPRLVAAFHLALQAQRTALADRAMPALLRWMRVQVPLFNPDRQLDRWLPRLRFLFQRWFLVLTALVTLGGFFIYVEHAREIHQRLGFVAGNLPLLFSCAAVMLAVHEYAHALTCKHFGGGVREMGIIVFLFFLPAAYCDVSDAHLFGQRRQKLWVTFAGVISTFVLASLGAWLWKRTVPTSLLNHTGLVLMVSGYGTVLTNLNPLLPLDGYFALCDWLAVDNLRDRAPEYCKADLWARVTNKPRPHATRREQRIFYAYFFLGTLYQLFYVLLAVSFGWLLLVRGGSAVGLALFALLVYLFYLRTYWLHLVKLWRQARTKQLFAWLLATAVAFVVLAFWRIPVTLSVPAVVHETASGYVVEGELPERMADVVRSPGNVAITVLDRWSVPVDSLSLRLRARDGKLTPYAHAVIAANVDRTQVADGLAARVTVRSVLRTTLWSRLWGEQWDRVIVDIWRLL